MPVYEYRCDKHGVFEAVQPMSEFRAPCACPVCGAESERVLFTAPRLGVSNRATIKAHGINERAADNPRRSKSHGPGCSCCSSASKSAKPSRTVTSASGAKSFPSARPWMISH